jgi:AraC family transcriptional activator of pyochelin receptor
MNSTISEPQTQGLYRTTIAGPGRSLADAFAQLEQSPRIERVLRHAKRDLLSARVTLTREEGDGYWELARIRNDFYIILGNFAYKDRRLELVPGDGLVQLNFKVSGDLTYAIRHSGLLRFSRPALHLWRQPKGIDMREWTAACAHERIVTISVRPEFLLEHCLASSPDIPSRLRAFVSEPRDQVDFCQLPLTAQMLDITTKLLDNPYTGALYLMYQEALMLELLCVAIGNIRSGPDSPAEEYSKRELRSLSSARQLLMTQFSPAPTLGHIARVVGLPEKALTRGFKAVYGETVFACSFRCRMQYALTLLRDQHWSVDQASEAVGYAHPTSFATAFRRHFALRPIDMKRLKRLRQAGNDLSPEQSRKSY